LRGYQVIKGGFALHLDRLEGVVASGVKLATPLLIGDAHKEAILPGNA
jgi:hypothetical protein